MMTRLTSLLKEYAAIVLAMLVGICMFSLWGWLEPREARQLALPVPIASADVQSMLAWQPLIKAMVQHGTLLPSQPSIAPMAEGGRLLPYFSLWVNAVLVLTFGWAGAMWIGQALLPGVVFALLVRIYQRQVPLLWAVTLAAVGVMAFSGYPFREFLGGLLHGHGWRELGATQMPELAELPVPATSTCVFLLLFLLSTRPRRFTFANVSVLTVLWALYSQFHAIDALFGLGFWFMYFPVRWWRQHGSVITHRVALLVLSQVVVAVALTSPVWGYMLSHRSGASQSPEGGPAIAAYYYIVYFLLPLCAVAVAYLFCRIDWYELVTRFWHIYVLLVLECVCVTLLAHLNLQADLESAQNRIALFFLHFYYYLPAIYFCSRQSPVLSESWPVRALYFIFTKASRVYLPLVLFLVGLFAVASAERHAQAVAEVMQESVPAALAQYKAAQTLPDASGVIFSAPLANLWAVVDMQSHLRPLWVNRFSDVVSEEAALAPLAAGSAALGWGDDAFARFMQPGIVQQGHNTRISYENDGILSSGIGYWLVYHKMPWTAETQRRIAERIKHYTALPQAEETLRQTGPWYIVTPSAQMPASKAQRVAGADGVSIYRIGTP